MNQTASKRICRQLTRDLLQGAKPLDAVDVFHKSLKSNASLTQSLTRTVRKQSNQVFTTICATFSLEGLGIKTCLCPFALSCMPLINDSRAAYALLLQIPAV